VEWVRGVLNRPYFAVDISGRKGLGALLSEAVLLCHSAETRGLIPRIVSSNPLYASRKGQDFLADYFDGAPGKSGALPRRLFPMRFRTLWSLYPLGITQRLPLDEAARVFGRHFQPRPLVSDAVSAVLDSVPGRRFDVSVHYRGTDKFLEAPAAGFERYADALHRHREGGGALRRVFLATDDATFDQWIRARFPDVPFSSYTLGEPLDASRGRHFSDMKPQDKALEAIVNVFLLAAAPVCIRGASYLSAMSRLANPQLQTVTLNRDRWGSTAYPESEILAEESSRMGAQAHADPLAGVAPEIAHG
jgi:hypothetical protein